MRGRNSTTIIRGLAVGFALAGCAIGLAGPASADLTDGSYTLTYTDGIGPQDTVVVTPCGTACKIVQIVPYTAGEYHLDGATWTYLSPSGPKTIDGDTLAGTANGHTFQLTKVG